MPFGQAKVKVFDCFSYNGEGVVVSVRGWRVKCTYSYSYA